MQNDLVYVNYGTIEDFDYLTSNMSVNLTGTIVIARYGKIYRGDKVSSTLFNAWQGKIYGEYSKYF